TTSVGGAAGTTETITPAPTYDGHTLLPTDYTLDTPATASSILEYTIRGAGLTQTIERSGELNMVGTEKTVTKTETVNGTEKQVVYTVYDVVKQDGEGATPAGTYTITITGTAGSYTADVTDIDTDFTFTMNSTAINAVNTYTITVSQ
ncbi:MAG: hypothetical protein IK088_08145, partial [Lachnospiraceae bacterium]|nr:hypothetical protein [Lachnospiraceae bacterium]